MGLLRKWLGFVGVAWSLLWRATVLWPICMLAGILMICFPIAVVVFPILAALHLYAGDWLAGAVFSVLWLLTFGVWRFGRTREMAGKSGICL